MYQDKFKLCVTKSSSDYELIDSGDGEKLERYGQIIMSRPDPQALWPKNFGANVWQKIDARFTKSKNAMGWSANKNVPEKWQINFGGFNLWIRPTAFKHTGLFPEHEESWNWITETVRTSDRQVSVLNLFGYTGGATLAAARGGASVCHVDASKVAVNWASENAEISDLKEKPIRWIVEDAKVFVKKEIKRERKYDAIIMDPPSFGRGPKGEIWKIEKDFVPLIEDCKKILSDEPLFFLINGYAAGYSPLAYLNTLTDMIKEKTGTTEYGELVIEESKRKFLLPAGIFARWRK